MALLKRKRRAVRDGLARMLAASGLEELFDGPPEAVPALYELLRETARGRNASIHREVCRAAQRRGITADYIVDRATVFLVSIAERERTDPYRILGLPPLASPEMIDQRWTECRRNHHPDVGGDPSHFRRLQEAHEILCDPERRADYERLWLRALGRLERVSVNDRDPAPPPAAAIESLQAARESLPATREPTATDWGTTAVEAAARLLLDGDALEPRLANGKGRVTVFALVRHLEAQLAAMTNEDVQLLRADIARAIGVLERARTDADRVAQLKRDLAT